MALRLTKNDRESIATKAVAFQFDPRSEALRDREHAIGMRAYEEAFPKKVRDQAKSLPEGWLRHDECLRFTLVAYRVTIMLREPVLVPSAVYNCHNLATLLEEQLRDDYVALDDAKKALRDERHRAYVNVFALTERASTLSRLAEMWPEGKPFYEHLTPRDQAAVPAVQVSEINRMLGLPLAA